MYQVAYSILHDSGLAEDAVSEAFLKLMKHNIHFEDPKSDDCKRYMISVIKHASINIYYIAVNYKDGTDYVVLEHALPSVHDCDVKKDNSNAFDCYEGIFALLFNRLVDTDTVQSITVNDTTYSLK